MVRTAAMTGFDPAKHLIQIRVATGPEFSNRSGPAGPTFRPIRCDR